MEIIFYDYYTLRDNTQVNLLLLPWDNSLLTEHIDGCQHGIFTVHMNIQVRKELLDAASIPLMLHSITISNKMPS